MQIHSTVKILVIREGIWIALFGSVNWGYVQGRGYGLSKVYRTLYCPVKNAQYIYNILFRLRKFYISFKYS